MSTFQIPPACNTKPRNTWQSFCAKLMQSRYVLRRNRVTFDHCSKRYHWSVERHSEPPLTKCLPIRQEILNVSQIGVTIPWNPPTIGYADRTAIAPQMSPLLPFGLLFQQSHLFPICVALTYHASRKNLHKICHVPRNYQCKWLLVSSSAPETSLSSFGSPGKFLFYMGRIETTEFSILVPPRHIDDFYEIQFLHWKFCDLRSSSHQKFPLWARL